MAVRTIMPLVGKRYSTIFLLLTLLYTETVLGNDLIDTLSECDTELISENASCYLTVKSYGAGQMILKSEYHPDKQCLAPYFLPMFPSEPVWNRNARTVFYLLLLIYFFMGVALISDVFMSAIEVITAKERIVLVKDENGNEVESRVLVWNSTIANLSLMAFGSSAPEIILSVIEGISSLSQEEAKDGLGPGTIVGSAAFNLLMITAICIVSIPKGENRKIEMIGVFNVTAFFSLFAYIWMWIVLVGNTKDVIDVSEAIITLLMFPLLLFVAYGQSKDWFCGKSGASRINPEGHVVGLHDKAKANGFSTSVKSKIAQSLKENPEFDIDNPEAAAQRAALELSKTKNASRMRYRMNALRMLFGKRRVLLDQATLDRKLSAQSLSAADEKQEEINDDDKKEKKDDHFVNISSHMYHVFEGAGKVTVSVIRTGSEEMLKKAVSVRFETSNGLALAGQDFEYTAGKLDFEPGQTEANITVKIIDDNIFEPDENFFITIKGPTTNVEVGQNNVCEVIIIDDDKPGEFSFTKGAWIVRETDQVAKVLVKRTGGVDGPMTVAYSTSDVSAVAGKDYFSTSGVVLFNHGETQKEISIGLIDDFNYEKDSIFKVDLEIVGYPNCGAEYGEHKSALVTITSDERFQAAVDEIALLMKLHLEKVDVETTSWKEQFQEAFELECEGEPSGFDYFMHGIMIFWKIIAAFMPPTSYYGGWPTFFCSLGLCGVVTTLIGDMATIFACLIGIPNSMAAITVVALGTSMPDTFASIIAARNDETADNSIGNVTGSNSVNVFVGLGLPWVIGSLYHSMKGSEYRVDGGMVSSSVFFFLIVAVSCLSLIYTRRFLGLGELGGPTTSRYLSAGICALLWFLYIALSALTIFEVVTLPF